MSFELRCNSLVEPIGVDEAPVFSWKVKAPKQPYRQKAYQIRVAETEEDLGVKDVWLSGRIDDAHSSAVYLPAALESSKRYYWNVTLWDETGERLQSGNAYFETGLFHSEDWKAEWIGMGDRYRTDWGILLRKEFLVHDEVAYAKAYISGLGYYELYINGEKVGDHVLDPAQTEYRQKILYVSYDVTRFFSMGKNAVGMMLGDGWYHQSQLMEGRGIYGNPCVLMQIEVYYKNGDRALFITDESWRTDYSPICRNNVYTGETYDARLEQPGWYLAGFDDARWFFARKDGAPKGRLCSQLMPPIRKVREIKPAALTSPQRGVFVYDFGVNFAGFVRLKLYGAAGNEITLRFAECLDETGMLNVETTGVFHIRAVQTIRYIFGRTGEIVYEPRFTYHGFRYMELTGSCRDPELGNVTGIKVNTDLRQTAEFHCSMPVLNQLHDMFCNTFTSNAHGIPTDCPAREKCGWTGDANIIADSTMILWDTQLFWDKYLDDFRTAYQEYRVYHNIVPGVRTGNTTVPAWGSAIVNIPWQCYQAYGNIAILEKYYDAMKEFIFYMRAHTDNWIYQMHSYALGDWLAPYNYPSKTHFIQISTVYFYLSCDIMAKVCKLLQKESDYAVFAEMRSQIKERFIAEFYDFEKHTYGTQTLNSFCESIGLCGEGENALMIGWCAEDIIAHDYHLTCGHIGLRYIFKALSNYGYCDVLEKVLLAKDYPSFGAQIQAGATTLWERWELTTNQSYNHPFKGSFCLWFYEDILGIQKTSPGYKSFMVKPNVSSLVRHAKGKIDTVYGEIHVDYKTGEYLMVVIPDNTSAKVYVPEADGRFQIYELGSGKYEFFPQGNDSH